MPKHVGKRANPGEPPGCIQLALTLIEPPCSYELPANCVKVLATFKTDLGRLDVTGFVVNAGSDGQKSCCERSLTRQKILSQ